MTHLNTLKQIAELQTVPDEELQWLIDEGELLTLASHDHVFKPGDPIDRLIVFMKGSAVIKVQQGNQFRIVGHFEQGSISGYLPYSRATTSQGYAQVTSDSEVLIFPKTKMRQMITEKEALTTALVHTMSTRIREFTKSQQQNDKMMALGKLSAGLAHELNNPSAAIVRSAQSLNAHLRLLPEGFKNVIKINMTDEQVDEVNRLLFDKIKTDKPKLSMMQRSSLEDDLLNWLEDNEISGSDEIAENLATFGFSTDELDNIQTLVNAEDLHSVIHWINQILSTERLVGEIEEASQRINKLVTSVKGYTHMDQAPEKQAVNIHDGIENTLTMLNHKLKKQQVEVIRKYDEGISQPRVLVSEMNQVWTNLIDNAIDAMDAAPVRQLIIRTVQDNEFVNVYVADSGSGIPEDAQGKVFDPFFTTKAIGQGTGLGLEVVHQIITNQHRGAITFTTRPGFTEFKVCIPIAP